MADPDEPRYTILDLATGKVTNSSREFSGKGRANYVNGDVYEGEYMDGVEATNTDAKWARSLSVQEGRPSLRGPVARQPQARRGQDGVQKEGRLLR